MNCNLNLEENGIGELTVRDKFYNTSKQSAKTLAVHRSIGVRKGGGIQRINLTPENKTLNGTYNLAITQYIYKERVI